LGEPQNKNQTENLHVIVKPEEYRV
jgi:hypothetical protein